MKANDSFSIFLNQAERLGWVLAVIGNEYLGAYVMPAGRVFVILQRLDGGDVRPGRSHNAGYKAMNIKTMPRKWVDAIRAQGGSFTIENALDNMGYNLIEDNRGKVDHFQTERRDWGRANKVPQWVKDLNAVPETA